MSSVTTEFVKQPIVTLVKKFVESWKVWMTVVTAFAEAEERVDAMSVRRRDESAPCCTGVGQNTFAVDLSVGTRRRS